MDVFGGAAQRHREHDDESDSHAHLHFLHPPNRVQFKAKAQLPHVTGALTSHFSNEVGGSPRFKADVERQREGLQELLQMRRHMAPLVPGVRRRASAAQPQRSEFLENDRVGRRRNLAAIG